jgi:acetoacetate decarboxylase
MASAPELQGLLNRTLNISVQVVLPDPRVPKNSIFLRMDPSARVTTAHRCKITSLSASDNIYEPVAGLFSVLEPTNAWWLRVDVGALADAKPQLAGTPVGSLKHDGMYLMSTYMLKYGGAPFRAERAEPHDPDGEYNWQNARFCWFTTKLNPEKVQKLMPPGVTLATDTATVFCVHFPVAKYYLDLGITAVADDDFPYGEFVIKFLVKLPSGNHQHITYILVDDEVGMILGRDIIGTPKKLANFTFPRSPTAFTPGADVSWMVERRGRKLITFSGRVGKESNKVVPGITSGEMEMNVFACQAPLHFDDASPAGQPVYITFPGTCKVHWSRTIDQAAVTIDGSPAEPLHEWLVGQPLEAGVICMDWGKKGGDTLGLRPVVGRLPASAAKAYWVDTYPVKYGGDPLGAPWHDAL